MLTQASVLTGIDIPGFDNQWIKSDLQIFKQAVGGVNAGLFYSFAETVKMDYKSLAGLLHLSSRTVSNYHQNKQAFEPAQGEHLLKLIALYDKGIEILGSVEEFSYWLNRPFWGSEEKPADWLITSGGIDQVIKELDRIAYGYPA